MKLSPTNKGPSFVSRDYYLSIRIITIIKRLLFLPPMLLFFIVADQSHHSDDQGKQMEEEVERTCGH